MSDDNTFHAWITKYALTTGVYRITAEGTDCETMISDVGQRYQSHFHGNDWHLTESAALARAEEMRTKKIASLQKQIVKLRAMRFATIDLPAVRP